MIQRNREILHALYEGPATCTELALELGRSKRDVNIGLWLLTTQEFVKSVGQVPVDREKHEFGRKSLKLYELTVRGHAVARAQLENGTRHFNSGSTSLRSNHSTNKETNG